MIDGITILNWHRINRMPKQNYERYKLNEKNNYNIGNGGN